LASLPNGVGTTGISHGSAIKLLSGGATGLRYLVEMNGMYPYAVVPGDVYLIESGIHGAKTGTYTGYYYCGPTPVEGYGCLPYEADPEMNAEIINAIEFGLSIVEGAGNGTVSLDDPSAYFPNQVEIGDVADIGSIIVGASMGSGSNVKASFSNAGNRVDAFSWGFNVATTGYQYGGYQWTMSPWMTPDSPFPDPTDNTNYYINNFGGTSSATAIVGGAVALAQSYAKNKIGLIGNGEDNISTRYIMPWKIKQIMFDGSGEVQQSGSSAYTAPKKCNHPDMGFTYPPGENPINCNTLGSNWRCEVGKRTNYNPLSCSRDFDCRVYGGFETINAKCVDGKCGSAFCAPSCDAGNSCASIAGAEGWLPFWVASENRCICHPPFRSAINESLNIGRQPRLDQVKQRIDNLMLELQATYPELFNDEKLTLERLQSLRNDKGVGLICGEVDPINHEVIGVSDPACPEFTEEDLWPSGTGIAKKLDFDGDGRGDLVSWTKGEFKIDLSSRGSGGDNFGEWDLIITYDPSEGVELPVVADIDSDTREDLVIFNRTTGTWYIKLMRNDMLSGEVTHIDSWDKIVTTGVGYACKDRLEMDYTQSVYGRPFIFDQNMDGWNDLSVACSDGVWRIDFGGPNGDELGNIDLEYDYLLPEHKSNAPGWAYAPVVIYNSKLYRVPEGLPDAGKLVCTSAYQPGVNLCDGYVPLLRGNSVILMSGRYSPNIGDVDLVGFHIDSSWNFLKYAMDDIASLPPNKGFGGRNCIPVSADFDGDGYDDRAVQCEDLWKIAYTGFNGSDDYHENVGVNVSGFRVLQNEGFFDYDFSKFTLPGRPYYGGVSYTSAVELMEKFRRDTGLPPPIFMDMVRVGLQ
jgi:hypothetical protein